MQNQHQHQYHNPTAMAAAAAAAGGPAAAAFFGQYPGLFDPSRTSHLDWHLHAASFHSAQGT